MWTNTISFWKTKLWSCLLRNSIFYLIFSHPFARFLPNSHLFFAKSCFIVLQRTFCTLSRVLLSAASLSFPTLIFSLMRHCYSTAVPVTSSSINAQVLVEVPFRLLFLSQDSLIGNMCLWQHLCEITLCCFLHCFRTHWKSNVPVSGTNWTFPSIQNRWTGIWQCFIMLVLIQMVAVWKLNVGEWHWNVKNNDHLH